MRIRSRFLNRAVVFICVSLIRLLFRTLRIRYVEVDKRANPFTNMTDEAFAYCVWHDAMTVAIFAARHPRTVALVSRHQDGSYLSDALHLLGIRTVRGSSSSGGASALKALVSLPANSHIVVTPDGPRGPRRKIKPGLVYLASRTGRPIVPTAFSADRSWRIAGSWTDLMVPKPFSRVYALTGEPIVVARDADEQQLAEAQRVLQLEMDRLADLADELVAVRGRAVVNTGTNWRQRSRKTHTTCELAA